MDLRCPEVIVLIGLLYLVLYIGIQFSKSPTSKNNGVVKE
jgi:hypothetical protein